MPTFAVVLSENDIVGADFGGTAVLQVPVALQPSITGTRSEYSGSFFDTDASDVAGTWIFEGTLSGDEFTVQGAYIAVE